MKKLVILLSAILILANLAFAQENMGARPISMGGAFIGLADDTNAIFVNPAGLGYLEGELASVSTKLSDNKEYTLIGGVERTAFGGLGIGYISSYSDLDASPADYDDPGDVPVKALNQTLVLSYARELNEFMIVPKSMGRFSLGTSVRLTSYRVNTAKGLAGYHDSKLDLDVGAMFKPNDNLAWGLTLKEFFGKADASGVEDAPSGPSLAAGVSGRVLGDLLIWSVEGQSLGCEFKPVSQIALRLGRDGEYNTAGIGLNIEGFAVDYAYLGKEEPVHYFAISVAIEKAPDHRQASVY
jgi:hypothetical protein